MGKSRRGEYSASNGRTSRSSHNYHHAPISEGLVAKVVLNTDALSGLERQKFTEEFTFEDGLSDSADLFKKDRNGNARQWARNHASVFHSLGKRGRWSLPELLKLDAHESCEESGRHGCFKCRIWRHSVPVLRWSETARSVDFAPVQARDECLGRL